MKGAKQQTVHIRDLTPDPHNRRAHNARNVGMIADSLQRDGFGRSILIDEDGVILAGNATVDAAAEAGIERVRVVEADGHEIIAVRRRGLTEEQKRRLAIADNRAAELATWDAEQLRADVDAGRDLSFAFCEEELAALLDAHAPEPPPDFPLADEATRFECPSCGFRWRGEPQ
jgi:ParB-like chromosome segregation protein Spo0J